MLSSLLQAHAGHTNCTVQCLFTAVRQAQAGYTVRCSVHCRKHRLGDTVQCLFTAANTGWLYSSMLSSLLQAQAGYTVQCLFIAASTCWPYKLYSSMLVHCCEASTGWLYSSVLSSLLQTQAGNTVQCLFNAANTGWLYSSMLVHCNKHRLAIQFNACSLLQAQAGYTVQCSVHCYKHRLAIQFNAQFTATSTGWLYSSMLSSLLQAQAGYTVHAQFTVASTGRLYPSKTHLAHCNTREAAGVVRRLVDPASGSSTNLTAASMERLNVDRQLWSTSYTTGTVRLTRVSPSTLCSSTLPRRSTMLTTTYWWPSCWPSGCRTSSSDGCATSSEAGGSG